MARARCVGRACGYLLPTIKPDYRLLWPDSEPRSLIHTLLDLDPSKRPNVKQILAHPWFTKCIYPSPPPSLPPSNAASPTSAPRQLPTPTIEEEALSFASSRSFPTPVAEEPDEAVASSTAPGSETETNTSFEWKDGDSDQIRSGRTSPTTVSSEHTPDDESSKDGAEGGLKAVEAARSSSPKPTLRRAGSEATIRKSDSDSSSAPSKGSSSRDLLAPGGSADPIEEIREEDEEHDAHPVDHVHEERDRLLKHLLPFTQHSKTPSRTKRRSVSSSFSERLTPSTSTQQLSQLPHKGAVPYVNVDYLSLLADIQQPEFSTEEEEEMLRALKLIGVDTGQLQHSVRTNACDTSGAFWWILWGKGATQRRESLVRRSSRSGSEVGDRVSGRQRERTARPPPPKTFPSAGSAGVSPGTIPRELEPEQPPPPPRVERHLSDASSIESQALSLRERLDSPLPPPPKGEPTAGLAQAVDDPFGSTSIHPGPINVEPPTPPIPSSQSMQALQVDSLFGLGAVATSRSYPNLSSETGSQPPTPSVEEPQSSTSPSASPGKSRRAELGKTRSSSVSMLQTLAAGLTRKKSDDRGFADEVDRRGSLSPAVPVLPTKASKSPPTPRAELLSLGRKPSQVDERRPSSTNSSRTEMPGPSHHSGSQMGSSVKSEDASSDYSDVVQSPSSARGSLGKAGLFSTFRTWLGADNKKRSGPKPRGVIPQVSQRSSSGAGSASSAGVASRSAARQSLERRTKQGPYYSASGSRRTSLQSSRPVMQHRSSSQASSHHSRRSSLNSGQFASGSEVLSPPRPALDGPFVSALHRRPSDPNRASDRTPQTAFSGDYRPRSRPSSVHSLSLHAQAMERKASRSPTASSAGSIHGGRVPAASPLQNYHRRVGSGSSTKVMRQYKIVNPPSQQAAHMRSASMASIRSSPNSRSSSPSLTAADRPPSLNRSNSGGDWRAGPRSFDMEYQSSDDAGRSTSSLGSYGPTVLVAHRPKSALSGGIPHSPFHSRIQHRSHWDRSDLTPKAKVVLRNVFAAKPGDEEGDWIDDDDCYEGGLGQTNARGQSSGGGSGPASGLSSSSKSSAGGPSSASAMPGGYRGRTAMPPPALPSAYHGRPTAGSSRQQSSPRLGSSLPLDGLTSNAADGPTAALSSIPPPSAAAARRQLPATGIRSSGIVEEEEPEDE